MNSINHVLQTADREGYAVPAFNYSDIWELEGIVEAAAEERATVYIASNMRVAETVGLPYLGAMGRTAYEQTGGHIINHLDHSSSVELCKQAVDCGYMSVMIDASMCPLEENIAMTKLAAELCSYAGVPVEGELGHVGATKDEVLGNYTDVAEAERFVKETGVSALAVMVGTAHGRYKKAPVLDIQRIRDIREATGKLPLVLHGGSGVPDEQIRMAVEAGIRKVNFATDLCYAFLDQVMVTERTTVALDVFMREPIHAIRDYCIGKIRLLGTDRIL